MGGYNKKAIEQNYYRGKSHVGYGTAYLWSAGVRGTRASCPDQRDSPVLHSNSIGTAGCFTISDRRARLRVRDDELIIRGIFHCTLSSFSLHHLCEGPEERQDSITAL
ncbi:hypothetical protein SAY86_012721 [Trapa natans]|uniref:Uncharacterized protein n=1 Tax=Trapa natans TaxID=22666 RepID=A0AAN7LY71_TRANT|nr:hypothetical protein SAY86_012721 [Trapa natans]